jgi:hypothetical protein
MRMSRRLKIVIVGLLVVSVLVVAVTGVALAQGATPTPTPKAYGWHGWGRGGFGCRGLCGQAGLEAAAKALGMTADELSTQLWGGRTLADLAKEKGVDLQTVRDAVDAGCQQATRDAIEQAVKDGRLSREQADWLLQGLEKGWLGGRGFGFGRGFGRGWWGVPGAPSTPGPGGTRWFQRPFVVPGSST